MKIMQITANILHGKTNYQTEEFEIPEGKNAEDYIKKIIKEFNDFLRPGEAPRKFISISDSKSIKFNELTDAQLISAFFEYLPKQSIMNDQARLDEIAGDYSQMLKIAVNKRSLKKMYYLIDTYIKLIWSDVFREVICEMAQRKWKNLNIRIKNWTNKQ